MPTKPESTVARFHMDEPNASESLGLAFVDIFMNKPLVIVCVGTDRSTGDSLGPLIGTNLSSSLESQVTVYGTLEDPVHALNLDHYVKEIKEKHPTSIVLAIDACLGKSENVGYISLKKGPLKPGTG